MNKKLIIFSLFVVVLAIAGFVIAETSPRDDSAEPSDLENELSSLNQELNGQGYDWLVDYNLKVGGNI